MVSPQPLPGFEIRFDFRRLGSAVHGPKGLSIPRERLLKELAMSKVALSMYESRTIARA